MSRLTQLSDSRRPWIFYPAPKIKRRGWSFPVENIEFSAKATRGFPRIWKDTDIEKWAKDELLHIAEPERSALHSFLVNLWCYGLSVDPKDRPIPLSEIYSRSISEGPSYAKWTAGFKNYFLSSVNERHYMQDDDLKEFNYLKSYVDEWKKRHSYEKPWGNTRITACIEQERFYRHKAIMDYIDECHTIPGSGHEYDMFDRINRMRKKYPMTENIHLCYYEVGWIFRSNDLFPWVPPKLDIRTVSYDEVKIDPTTLEEFRQTFRSYLKNQRLDILNVDIPNFLAASDSTRKAKEGEQYRLPLEKPANTRGVSRLAYIPRELKECRSACVEDHASLIRIRQIDMAVQRILDDDKRCVSKKSPDVLKNNMMEGFKIIGKFGERMKFMKQADFRNFAPNDPQWTWSYCRDFKKEGLTKPRKILSIMLEELHRRWPDVEAFNAPHFFDVWEVNVDGDILKPLRGHGLGMANSLTTMMQIIIELMITNRTRINPTWSGYSNDDAAVIISSSNALANWIREDEKVCGALSLKYKKAATFTSPSEVVLCEVYVSKRIYNVNKKDSFSVINLGQILKAINASHARDLAQSMNIANVPEAWMQQVVGYWGWNLYRNEQREAPCVGGWWRSVEHGVDYSLYAKNGFSTLRNEEAAAFLALREVKIKFCPWKKIQKYKSKLAQANMCEEFFELIGEKMIDSSEMFRSGINARENVRAWQAYEARLQKSYSRWYSGIARRKTVVGWREVFEKESKERLKDDILPPLGLRKFEKSKEIGMTTDFSYNHPYSKPDIVHAYELWCQKEIPLDYVMKYGKNTSVTLQSGAIEKGPIEATTFGRAVFLRPDKRDPLALREWNRIAFPSAGMDQWHDPLAVTYVADRLGSRYRTPLCLDPPKEKIKILESRKQYYGDIPPSWLLVISAVKPADQPFISRLRGNWIESEAPGSKEKFFEAIDLLRSYPGLGRNLSSYRGDAVELADLMKKFMFSQMSSHVEKRRLNERRDLRFSDTLRPESDVFEGFDDFHPDKLRDEAAPKTVRIFPAREDRLIDVITGVVEVTQTLNNALELTQEADFSLLIPGGDLLEITETELVVWDDAMPIDEDALCGYQPTVKEELDELY
jgi:hypothetical protein